MNRIFTKITSLLMLMSIGIGVSFAQTYCLQMTEVSNDGSNLVLDITMSGNVAFGLGSANLQFEATPGAFGPATLVSSPLALPVYFTPTVTQPLVGSNSFNIELVVPGTGITIDATSVLLGQITMPILDGALAMDGISWSYTGTTVETVVFLDDESTLLFATDPLCLEGYMDEPAESNVRIIAIDKDLKEITFKNFGGTEQDISAWRLCSNFDYTFAGIALDAEVTLIAGDYLLSPEEEMTVSWTPAHGFRPDGDDMAIYLPTGSFNSSTVMVDYTQYLTAGNVRESVAVTKGIWGVGDFVDGVNPYSFIGTGDDTGVTFWTGFVAVDGCTDETAANYDPAANNDDGSCLYDVTFNVDMNCESGFVEPALEALLFGWCGGCVPLTDEDMDGIWSVTVQLPAGLFEYKYAVDAFASQEDLVDDMQLGGTCAPITDFATFANREVNVVAGLVLNDVYGTCGVCDPLVGCTDSNANNYSETAITDDGSCLYDVTFNVDLSCYDGNDPNIDTNTPGSFTTIAIEGPSLGWCGSCVTLVDDGNDMWSVTLTLPVGPFEYKYAHDAFAGQEQLVDDMVDGGTCAPITDFDVFANREITIPATLVTNDTYGSCDACGSSCPTDLNGDGTTNGEDFSIFLGNFDLDCIPDTPCPTDLNGDNTTNGEDFSVFLGNFGLDCPPTE